MTTKEETFATRFGHWMRTQNISFKEISDVLGSTQQAIRGYARGDSFIDFKKLSKLAAHYPDLNLNWLITGKGEMLNTATIQSEISTQVAVIDVQQIKNEITESVTKKLATTLMDVLSGKSNRVAALGQFAMSM